MENVIKKTILNIIIFLLTLAFPLILVNAQQQASQRWVCLSAVGHDSHTGTISVDPTAKLQPNSNTYIFECLSTSECTSGDPAVDQTVFGKNNYGELNGLYGYNFEGSTLSSNPLMSDGAGEIPTFDWTSSTTEGHERRWLAMNYYTPAPTSTTANEGGQQIGTFDFESVYNASDCVALNWDPYGRIFDSRTLEPVYKATVTLYKKDGDIFRIMTPMDVLGGNIKNPQITKEDGGFSFVVPDATYKLDVSHDSYSFPETLSNLQSNYSKIYTDIYPAQTGVDIVQQGAIVHRDIPLKPLSMVPVDNPTKLMNYFEDLNKITKEITIRGRVSHPFAAIKAYSKKDGIRYRLLTSIPVKADKMGNFVLKIDQSKFEPTEVFGTIVIEKTNLTAANLVKNFIKSLFFKDVNAQVFLATAVDFEPILNYVEGYAYDSTGKVLPNATVSVNLEFSKKPYYQTVADDKGFYKISSEFLPSMPYHLSYASANKQVIPTTNSEFIAQNKVTITESDININQFKDSQGKVIETTPTNSPNPLINNQATKTSKNYSQIIIFGLIILFLVIIALLVLVYLKKKTE